jgi:hypothetical protein
MNVAAKDSVLQDEASTFLKKLKKATQEQHNLLESNFLLSAII